MESSHTSVKSTFEKLKTNDITEVTNMFENIAANQDSFTELALRGSGDYELSYLYRDNGVSTHTWLNLTFDKQKTVRKNLKRSSLLQEFLKKNIT